jgi:DNA polymerase I-like protein with 3'-5' exonuclease and polymerase domains
MLWGNIEREGKNSPVQGGNADITKLAMGCGFDKNGKPFMWHLLPLYGGEIVNHIYDEVVVECDEDKAEACLEMVGDCFTRAGAEIMSKVVMEWEGKVSDCWTK